MSSTAGATRQSSEQATHRHKRHTNPDWSLTNGLRFHLSITSSFAIIAAVVASIFGIAILVYPETAELLRVPRLLPSAIGSTSPVTEVPAKPSNTYPPAMASIRRTTPLIFPAKGRHTATVIFAHGLGDTGSGWSDAVDHWRRRQKLDEVKFILPNAPSIPISVNGGFQMPGWFDIIALGASVEDLRKRPAPEDAPGVLASRDYFNSLVQEEITAGIPSERIVLGGFSQGGAMSIFTGVTSPVKLGGIVGLSSWLLLSQSVKDHIPKDSPNKETPIFMGHGDRDPLVRYDLGLESQRVLKELGYDVKLETYRGMEHSACPQEFDDVGSFLASRLPAKGN